MDLLDSGVGLMQVVLSNDKVFSVLDEISIAERSKCCAFFREVMVVLLDGIAWTDDLPLPNPDFSSSVFAVEHYSVVWRRLASLVQISAKHELYCGCDVDRGREIATSLL